MATYILSPCIRGTRIWERGDFLLSAGNLPMVGHTAVKHNWTSSTSQQIIKPYSITPLRHTPHSLFPTPYSLFLTHYSLFPTPYSSLPTLYTLHPIPYPLFPTPYSLFLIPYSLLHTPYLQLPTPCSLLPTPCSLFNRKGSKNISFITTFSQKK